MVYFSMGHQIVIFMSKSTIFIFAILILSGCSKSLIVQTELIRPADLNRVKTFRFVDDANPNLAFNEANQERIKLSIANELAARNYIESQLADFEISIMGGVEMVRQTAVRYNYSGAYPYYYPRYYPNSDMYGKSSDNSSLIINVLDKGQLVWQGVATGNFKPKKKQHIEVAIAEVVKSIFKEFPYQSQL
jgi:hypothetical protein